MQTAIKPLIESVFQRWIVGVLIFLSVSLQAQVFQPVEDGDTVVVSRCRLPITLINSNEGPGFTYEWTIGYAYVEGSMTGNSLKIGDFITDTTLVTYTVRYGASVIRVDSILCIKDTNIVCPGELIDTSSLDLPIDCSDTISLAPSLDTTLYTHYYWYGENIDFINSDTSTIIQYKPRGPGPYSVSLLVGTKYNAFGVLDTFYDTATCIPPPIVNAGKDTTITYCNLKNFTLYASQPMDGETGKWMVNQLGIYFDHNLYNSSMVDVAPGVYTLVWKVSNSKQSAVDTVIVRVLPTTLCPVTNAGIDLNTSCGDTITLAANQPESNEIGKWYCTYGDVSFVNDRNPTTKMVVNTGGLHQLKWIVSSPLYMNSRADYMNIQATCLNKIQGTVQRSSGLQKLGKVILIQKNGNVPTVLKKVNIVNGTFEFKNVNAGNYYLYAIPYEDGEHTIADEDYFPTFYVNKESFNLANPINIFGNTFGVDFKLAPRAPSSFGNSVRVLVSEDNSIISDLPMLMFDSNNKLVSWAMLGHNEAVFRNIPAGSYHVEIPYHTNGYTRTSIVQLSGNQETTIDLRTSEKDALTESSKVNAYPNPFSDHLQVKLNESSNNSKISILNYTTGVELLTIYSEKASDIDIQTEALEAGVYLLKIESAEYNNIQLIHKIK